MNSWREWRDAGPGDFAVVGDPIAHSLSPRMHAAAYHACGLSLTYSAVRIPASEFMEGVAHLASLGYRGLNVTLPLKAHALSYALERGGLTGAEIGALPGPSANTLNLRTGQAISTDEPGFLRALNGVRPGFRGRILLLGAGGTSQALAPKLVQEGWTVSVWNRTPGKWEALADRLGLDVCIQDSLRLRGIDVIVNGTSSGLSGDELPIPWAEAAPWVIAMDLVYGRQTPFLQQAAAIGLDVHDGTVMLVEQGALSFEWWLNIPAPREDMLAAVAHGHS